MPIFISSKGNDFSVWRPAADFATAFREVLLKRTATLTSEQAEALFLDVENELDRRAAEHDAGLTRLRKLTSDAEAVDDPALLRPLLEEFYSTLYEFSSQSRSAPAFYQLNEEMLKAVSRTVFASGMRKMGQLAGKLPPVAVIALGPSGRHEFSPFCHLQLLLVHGEADPLLVEPLGLLGRTLHEEFEAAGLQPDQVITTRNPDWCGDLGLWRQRLVVGLESGAPTELINLLRLADQTALIPNDGLDGEFSALCMSLLQKSRTTMAFFVTRVMGLSNGLGMMGGLRLEKLGPFRGLFALFDHALLPLTASVTALSLIKGGNAVGTRQRIRDLLFRQEINVEMSERLLLAWYTLQELRLARERKLFPERNERESLYCDVEALPDAELERLREALETVASVQRHVTITFSGWEEQTAC